MKPKLSNAYQYFYLVPPPLIFHAVCTWLVLEKTDIKPAPATLTRVYTKYHTDIFPPLEARRQRGAVFTPSATHSAMTPDIWHPCTARP